MREFCIIAATPLTLLWLGLSVAGMFISINPILTGVVSIATFTTFLPFMLFPGSDDES